MDEKSTDALTSVLLSTKPENIQNYLEQYSSSLLDEKHPFSTYMRSKFKEKALKQQDVFLAADISEGYGYKLIAEEKRTKRKDIILRLCIAAHFSLLEAQKALKLYGMSPLYAKIPRDAVLIIAFNSGIYDISRVDNLLLAHKMEPMMPCSRIEE
ncbi:hypothetical protein OBV_10690 [Oscillibacter valericigenes Sjm18-20]|nr:hypothetical protein OBV_10690 [Oscillibacter valericigenes Sjm18-20]